MMQTSCRLLGALALGVIATASQAQTAAVPAPRPMAAPAALAADPNAIRVLLTPELETVLAAQMLGRIANVHAGLGTRVAKGRTLVSFDCSEPDARLRMAQAEYANAKESLDVKQRLRKLDAAGDTEVVLAQTMADKAKAAIALSQVQMGQCLVKAPFSGHVVKLHVKPAQGVNVGMPLLEMVSDGPLKLRLNVPSRWLHALKKDTPFEVLIDETRKSYAAKVTAINARVDAVAQTVELEARIEGRPPELLAGMSGVARFSGMQ
ncbi:efflux RND transporter periplasmic adaptor subunit [Comamonas composti]|uniref:efflux RND transporter periplasmic adaptor subunit n=1 Tax=Comamonas composti TaxID=408558 RepID=UPI000410E22F|nr:efflux RND transporter periplasmic adaptor subunit [Comamonas composti]